MLQGICDGAGCVIVASEAAVKRHNLTPLVRVAGYGVSGCDPSIMGIGPVPAIKALLGKVNMNLDQMGLIEVGKLMRRTKTVSQFLMIVP